jgi:osmotically-inducible protein OsmY
MKILKKTNLYVPEDKRLLDTIKDRIRWDIRVSNSDISVQVKDGVVILDGYFDLPYRHAAALDVIGTTEGLKGIEDRSMVVDDYRRTDKDLEILISKQLLSQNFLSGEWIDVTVRGGVVTLEGAVYRSRLKAFAARSVWELSGVKDCFNLIDLKEIPQTTQSVHPILRMFTGSPHLIEKKEFIHGL